MEQRFRDQVVWITGGGSGIGRALALCFAREGARVAVSGRREDRLRDTVAALEALGARGLAVPCDVTDESQVQRAVERVVEELGRLDVAVANAGFSLTGETERLRPEDWRRQFETNVIGLATTARHALPQLRESRGRLALMGSVLGFVPVPGSAAYVTSKAAVRAIGQTLSAELHGSGVSCTTIHPGYVESEITRLDENGRFDPSRPDLAPALLRWPAERAAEVCVSAIHRRKREQVFTAHGRLGAWLGRRWPGLAHFVIKHATALRRTRSVRHAATEPAVVGSDQRGPKGPIAPQS